MPRVKTGVVRRRRHKKVLSLTKGFRGTNNRLYKRAKEALLHAGQYAFIGRKLRKRDQRKLWIIRINAALQEVDQSLKYSWFISVMKKANVQINRKMLSELAIRDFSSFTEVVKTVRGK
ncbi:MAG: 50S ribosomal protein L20 [Candidatus Pacebacteria bacterium]|nr:50S ribosomal protein L20 [Candidatus Paceibacterota bacterium]PIR60322.1 MAG: 50S ribosomal protein L20 [Candidatus Pacebacteria bacterium CG10_big_fil_rev_8_21_14_0_10_44_54]